MKPSCDHIAASDIVMCRHDEIRQQRLVSGRLRSLFPASLKGRVFARNLVRPERGEKIKMGSARCFGATVGEIDDLALSFSVDGRMRIIDEARQSFRKPVIALRSLFPASLKGRVFARNLVRPERG